VDAERLKARWRANRGSPRVNRVDLRAGQPASLLEGSYCERCEELTADIICEYGSYWLCEKCAAFHAGFRRRAALVPLDATWAKPDAAKGISAKGGEQQ
jgi:hypothetical protein